MVPVGKSLLEPKGEVSGGAGCGVCAINTDRVRRAGPTLPPSAREMRWGHSGWCQGEARSAGFSAAQGLAGD